MALQGSPGVQNTLKSMLWVQTPHDHPMLLPRVEEALGAGRKGHFLPRDYQASAPLCGQSPSQGEATSSPQHCRDSHKATACDPAPLGILTSSSEPASNLITMLRGKEWERIEPFCGFSSTCKQLVSCQYSQLPDPKGEKRIDLSKKKRIGHFSNILRRFSL